MVFGFFVMVLGTYANLGAIDDTQTSANVAIDRLPDIHITHPTENIFMTPSKIDQPKNKIEMGPEKPFDKTLETDLKLKGSKRKPTKIQRDQSEAVREINLVEKEKVEIPPKPLEKIELSSRPANAKIPPNSNGNVIKPVQTIDELKLNVANQLIEPTTVKKSSDLVINNDAIQKEEREIEIDANEQRQNDVKRTQDIVNAVKNQLSKQNEENQQILLQKVNEISEKVNRIAIANNAQMDERPVPPNSDPNMNLNLNPIPTLNPNPSTFDTQKADKLIVNEIIASNGQGKPSMNNDDERKNLPLPPVPVVKLLAESKKSSQMPSQLKDVKPDSQPTPEIEIPKIPENVVEPNENAPLKIEKANEIVGRDLLSNSNDNNTTPPTVKQVEIKSIRDKTDV